MYLNILCLPFLSFVVLSTTSRHLGIKGSGFLSTSCLGITVILSVITLYEICIGASPTYLHLFFWLQTEMFQTPWAFYLDSLTSVLLVVISSISFLVHFYSIEYMQEDPHFARFMSYLSLFSFFMIVLVTGNNFLQMFVGWEGVGFCSYLLINFWFTRIQANKAAIKAMIVNRVGDFGLVLGILGIFINFKSIEYATVFGLTPYYWEEPFFFLGFPATSLTWITLLVFVGAVGKSAQLGLHTWLPDAMEGPTPVSALIHAATMVTAGVFLLSRCSPILEYAPLALACITCLGAMTSFFAATTALVQNDLKRVIAYSTCSQLGYMIFACGLSSYSVSVFHLTNHAFFKALLFLSAGNLIHGLRDEQDMRKMGGLRRSLPFTYAMMVIGSLALIGFPYLSGFYSKDIILELAYANHGIHGDFAYLLGCAAAFCTAFYSMRLLYLGFLAEPMGVKSVVLNSHESSIFMNLPLGILALFSIFLGYFSKDLMIGWGGDFFGNAFFCLPSNYYLIDGEFSWTWAKLLPVALSLTGFTLSFFFYCFQGEILYKWKISCKHFYKFLNRKWFFDKVYNYYLGNLIVYLSYKFSYKFLDRWLLETLGPWGVKSLWLVVFKDLRKLHTGLVYHLGLSIFLSSGLFFILCLQLNPLNVVFAIYYSWVFISYEKKENYWYFGTKPTNYSNYSIPIVRVHELAKKRFRS